MCQVSNDGSSYRSRGARGSKILFSRIIEQALQGDGLQNRIVFSYLLYGAVLLVVLRLWMGEWTGTAVCKFQREHVIELFPHDAGSLEEGG